MHALKKAVNLLRAKPELTPNGSGQATAGSGQATAGAQQVPKPTMTKEQKDAAKEFVKAWANAFEQANPERTHQLLHEAIKNVARFTKGCFGVQQVVADHIDQSCDYFIHQASEFIADIAHSCNLESCRMPSDPEVFSLDLSMVPRSSIERLLDLLETQLRAQPTEDLIADIGEIGKALGDTGKQEIDRVLSTYVLHAGPNPNTYFRNLLYALHGISDARLKMSSVVNLLSARAGSGSSVAPRLLDTCERLFVQSAFHVMPHDVAGYLRRLSSANVDQCDPELKKAIDNICNSQPYVESPSS